MRVTFWGAHGSTGLIVEHGEGRICHVVRHPDGDADADATLVEAAAGVDLLIFPGGWEEGLVLKRRSGAKLLALAPGWGADAAQDAGVAEAAARKSPNVFVARRKMTFEL